MSTKVKVLIFSRVNFSILNGGVLCTANMLSNIRRVPEADFILVSTGGASAEAPNGKFAATLQLDHFFVQHRELYAAHIKTARRTIASTSRELLNILLDKYYFLLERYGLKQKHVDSALADLIDAEKPDLIIIDGIWSALCVPSVFAKGVPCYFVTHNREVDIHVDFKRHAQDISMGPDLLSSLARWIAKRCNWVSNMRQRNYVNRLYARCAGIIALTNHDLPNDLPAHALRAVLPPLLEKRDLRWSYQGHRSVLFVGNISYFANRLAIEWICGQLAPALLGIDNTIRINIVGVTENDMRRRFHLPNISFLGYSDKNEVMRHMMTDDLFIAPTAQRYGAKLKLAECASHGMPFVATSTAMGGLPFLTCIPQIDLERPEAAAHLIREHLNNPVLLSRLSRNISERVEEARREQSLLWSSVLKGPITQQHIHNANQPMGPGLAPRQQSLSA